VTQQEKVKVGILGASGYGGGELLRRLARHPRVEISGVGSRQYEGQSLSACWPQLGGVLDLTFRPQEEVVAGCEVLFTATPHGATAPLVGAALDAGKRVVDLSADFRLSAEDYPRWYGHPHPCPELLSEAVYGLSELHREEVRGARLVANPGCNATAASLALAPLAACKLLGADIIINIAAAVSGAGRKPDMSLHYGEVNENAKPYKVAGTHRHIPEIEDTLGRLKSMGRQVRTHASFTRPVITFTPHLIPMTRGILATCTTRPESERPLGAAFLLNLYRDFYQNEPLITVQDELPQTKATSGTDRCLVSVRYDSRSGQVIAFAAIDNLGKGAAGQAVQNFNLMLGFAETLGLETQAVWP
jgi:N-acetyl-gamma-glutamyl-phosphate reductase